jgi:hypothetical protein
MPIVTGEESLTSKSATVASSNLNVPALLKVRFTATGLKYKLQSSNNHAIKEGVDIFSDSAILMVDYHSNYGSVLCSIEISEQESESVGHHKLTHSKVIRNRRMLIFACLPVFCSNDIEHGSLWFAAAGLFGALICLIPVATFIYCPLAVFELSQILYDLSTTPSWVSVATWMIASTSSLLFGIGSIAFARAFREPAVPPCVDTNSAIFRALHCVIHPESSSSAQVFIKDDGSNINVDEFIASVLFFFGSIALIPGMIFLEYYSWQHQHSSSTETIMYFFGLCGVLLMCYVSYRFAELCGEPSCHNNGSDPFGAGGNDLVRYEHLRSLPFNIDVHIQNDWLIGLWILLFTSIVSTIWSLILLISSVYLHDFKYRTFIYALR